MRQYILDFILILTISIVARASMNYYQNDLPLVDGSDFIVALTMAMALLWSRWFWGLKSK